MPEPFLPHIKNKFKSLTAHIRKDGLRYFLSTKIYDFVLRSRFRYYGLKDLKSMEQEGIANSINNDAHLNWPSSYYELKQGLGALPISVNQINLLDYGCGNGNVLLYGMFKNMAGVTGIDLDKKALHTARKNCSVMAAKGFKTTFTVIEADAAGFQIPEEVNVIYLFNPFGEQTTNAVAANIFSHVKAFNKVLYVIYFLPSYRTVFDNNSLCTILYERTNRVGHNAEMTVYRVGEA